MSEEFEKGVLYLDKLTADDILSILRQQVKPARGCTEPVAVALTVATILKEIEGKIKKINIKIKKINIRISPNIYKNGIRVGIPGTNEKGIVFAVALAAICADPKLGLELFKNVNSECVKKAKKIISRNIINVEIVKNKYDFYIQTNIETDKEQACCIVKENHTNIVYLEANGAE